MGNILDYLDWRGDLTLEQTEFNEVDNLLLSQLVYVDFKGIVPDAGPKDSILLSEASRIFFANNDEQEIMKRVSMTKNAIYVLKKMAESKRFCNARLFGYRKEISEEEQSQFAVVSVLLKSGDLYLAFSGTDETIVGWHEDFNMMYLTQTPGHKKALAYVDAMNLAGIKTLRLGGHSKGGNLAVYAAMYCQDSVRAKLVRVYNNDGPGFAREVVESEVYQACMPMIQTILPESSVVGILFEHQEKYEIVRSTNHGLKQHDALSWEVLGTGFIGAERISKKSLLLDEAMKKWLRELSVEERRQVVETAFQILDVAGIKTVDDFYSVKLDTITKATKAHGELPAESKKMLSRAMKLLFKSIISVR